MPKYSFECYLWASVHPQPQDGGHEDALARTARQMPLGFLRVWLQLCGKGAAAPANSGVSKHDYPTADQAVGERGF
jgi:hypothetical protein